MKKGTLPKVQQRTRRRIRVRARVTGSSIRPRLSVFRGLKFIYAQIIDDTKGKTLVALHSKNVKAAATGEKTQKVSIAYELGKELAKLAKEKGIEQVVFDRGGYRYHGRVQALADGAREGGLQF